MHIIEFPLTEKHEAFRGTHPLPYGSQLNGRDHSGESYLDDQERSAQYGETRQYVITETTAEFRERVNTPYLWLVQQRNYTSVTAFRNGDDLLAWCRAYAVTLSPFNGRADFVAVIGPQELWEPLEMRPVK